MVRTVMIAAAARQWGVPESECTTLNSEVLHTTSSRRVSYGALVPAACSHALPDFKTVKLKDPSQFHAHRETNNRISTYADKCTGAARFGLDVRLPGMVYAVIARCPTFGGTPAKFDATKALAVPGVLQVFEVPARGYRVFTAGGIASWRHRRGPQCRASKALQITWNHGPH